MSPETCTGVEVPGAARWPGWTCAAERSLSPVGWPGDPLRQSCGDLGAHGWRRNGAQGAAAGGERVARDGLGRWTAPRGRACGPTGRARRAGSSGEGGGQSTGCWPRGRGPGTAPFPDAGGREAASEAEGDPPSQRKGRGPGSGGQLAASAGRVAGGRWPGPRAQRPLHGGSVARRAEHLAQQRLTAEPRLPTPVLALTGAGH